MADADSLTVGLQGDIEDRDIAELVRGEIGIVSTGPERNDTLMRSKSALASWFV